MTKLFELKTRAEATAFCMGMILGILTVIVAVAIGGILLKVIR